MTPDPTLPDEELARIEAAMLSPHVSYAHFTTTMAPRLIAALRASRDEVERLRRELDLANRSEGFYAGRISPPTLT